MKTAIMYSPMFLRHDTGPNHPETPSRLRVIMDELNGSRLLKTGECGIVTPKPAKRQDLELVHEADYIELVKKTCLQGGGLLDLSDTVVSRKSYDAAVLAVGAVIDAVDMVNTRKVQNAFALVRPPGHHAGPYYALGFCLFNNAALGAAHLLNRLNYDRVLVLDIDAHHGNGTQEIFYDTNRVLYMSLHEDPTDFPGTGFADEIGEAQGRGYTVNIPFPLRVDNRIYLEAFNKIVLPIIEQYRPQFMLVSAGFDGHYTDPVAELGLSLQGYSYMFSRILTHASQFCEGKVVVTLEGGYSLSFLGKMVTSAIAKMAGIKYDAMKDIGPMADAKTRKNAEQIIKNVKRIQSLFWRL